MHVDPTSIHQEGDGQSQAHAVRLAFELGCDAAKCVWTGDEASFTEVAKSAPIPLLMAGGPSNDDTKRTGHGGICTQRRRKRRLHGPPSVCTPQSGSDGQGLGHDGSQWRLGRLGHGSLQFVS